MRLNFFVFFVNYRIKNLVVTTRTIPEFDRIEAIFFEEIPEFS